MYTSELFSKILLFLFTGCILASCTGGVSGQKPVDGEWVQGKTTKEFFRTVSATEAVVVAVSDANTTKQKVIDRQIVSSSSLDANLIQVSSDGMVLTIKGEPGIYEYSKISLTSVVEGKAQLPPATVETFCRNLSPSSYQEFSIVYGASGYQFFAINGSTRDVIGGTGSITKNDLPESVSYAKSLFGTLTIDKTAPNSQDATLFKSNFVGAASPWDSAFSMNCHQNNVIVSNAQPANTTVVKFNTVGPGTFIVPAGVTSITIELWGGGGGAGLGDSSATAGAGGGAYLKKTVAVTAGTSISYQVGAGGTHADIGAHSATDGSNSFCTLYSLTAGGGKASSTGDMLGFGAGGVAVGGDINLSGGAGIQAPDQSHPGAGGNGANGGVGGSASDGNGSAQNGMMPGGGGAGNFNGTPGNGGDGQAVFSYVAPS